MRLPLLCLTLLCPSLAAAQTYDLRAAGKDDPKSGDVVIQEETERQDMKMKMLQNGQVAREEEQTQGLEQSYREEFHEVDEEGDPVRVTRTYTRFVDLETQQSLEGELVVEVARNEAGTYAYTLPEGAKLPDLLRRKLDALIAERNAPEEERAEKEKDPEEIFTPEEPQAVGATWTVDPAVAVEGMGLEDECDVANSSVTGTLVSAEEKGGVTMLTIKVELKLKMLSMGGQPCPEPLDWDMTMLIELPDGGGLHGSVKMDGTVVGSFAPQGAPPGISLDIDMKLEGNLTRSIP